MKKKIKEWEVGREGNTNTLFCNINMKKNKLMFVNAESGFKTMMIFLLGIERY